MQAAQPQINSPVWEVSRPPVGLGIIGTQSSDDALLALATKLAQFVPMPPAKQTFIYGGQGMLELDDLRVNLELRI